MSNRTFPKRVWGSATGLLYRTRELGWIDLLIVVALAGVLYGVVDVTMSLPLFDRNQGNKAKASSAMAQVQEELRSGEVELRAELESASQDLRAARANAESVAQEQLRLAATVRDNLNQSYEAGKGQLIDMLDAQRDYRDTYRLYISSRADYWRALYKYSSAIGQQTY
jgi:cobalt-zinc-cadmium efflux system outer membrane protein